MTEKKQGLTKKIEVMQQKFKTFLDSAKGHLKQKEVHQILRYSTLFGARKCLVWICNVGLFLLCYLAVLQFLKLVPGILVEHMELSQKQAQQVADVAGVLQNFYLTLVMSGWALYWIVRFLKWTEGAGSVWTNAKTHESMLFGTMMPYFTGAILFIMGTPVLKIYSDYLIGWMALAILCIVLKWIERWYVSRIQRSIFQDKQKERTLYTDSWQHLLEQEKVFLSVSSSWQPYIEEISSSLTKHKVCKAASNIQASFIKHKPKDQPASEWMADIRVKGTWIHCYKYQTVEYLPSGKSGSPELPKLKIYANTFEMEGKEVHWLGEHLFYVEKELEPAFTVQLKEWWKKRKRLGAHN
ncbi:hypothetical protein [Listeria riparia]|uniref:Uncharacterized protein n=1 Tax=Listeria riparia FSL S10-1204 TaxID=1265816 RepID=W7DCB4_9LIST|nr:hypothetical protein [Listeria riparia]EUJ42918.1 hypothetical protein PRIP_14732 [Listeria riparia FSL S10-1204]